MSTITQVESNAVTKSYETAKKKTKDYGRTIGTPELSEEAAKYYEELKAKYSNMDFILVSEDKKEEAQAQAGSYANANRMVVLIDEEKIEKMASDETYRAQYEGIISGATAKMGELQSSLSTSGANIKTFGMQVKDGGIASYFAVLDKSLKVQKEHIQKTAQKKAEERKKTKKAAEEERAEKRISEKEKTDRLNGREDTVTITASSMEDLIKKINDYVYNGMSDLIQTNEEKMIGQNFDTRG